MEGSAAGHRCIRKLFGLDSETCIRKLFPVDSETFPGGFGNFPVGFGNFPGCIRELVYSGNWDLVTKPLSSETFPGGFGNLYSETFLGGFGNFSGWIRKLSGWIRKLVFGNFSEWIRKLFRLDSETCPVGFGNFSGWIQKLDSETCFLRSIWRNLTPPDPSLRSFVATTMFSRPRNVIIPPHPTPALDFV